MKDQYILCVPNKKLVNYPTGLVIGPQAEEVLKLPRISMLRAEIEDDPRFRQLIAYAIITCDDMVLSYSRAKDATEARLRGQYSIGIGGHIEDEDEDYYNGATRELNEELGLYPYLPDPVAMLHDNTSMVEKVHIGIVHVVRLTDEDVKSLTTNEELNNMQWINKNKLIEQIEVYELWSRLCIERINELL
jgi:predicted NUDIX family phosphoesterase